MKVIQLLHQANQLNDEPFVCSLYAQLLNRAADKSEIAAQAAYLRSGMPRTELIIGILNSDEAIQIYAAPSFSEERQPTVADKMSRLLAMNHEDMVHNFYTELLCRYPDAHGYPAFLRLLNEGHSPLSLVNLILRSDEWNVLFHADRYYFARKILAEFYSRL
ncbi:DUF4214 domain-containing protein [Paenibacillus humicola]|uniref:DUF4214 domain-containing protein n=1 Tax=Paenibacillus humicola TaxID=3110540 RepID=UPI00237B0C03|nr:DUF4214 domain-containing protein [Paenibacillus humicola]